MQKGSEIGSKSEMEGVVRETTNMVGEIGSGGMANPHHGSQQTRGVCPSLVETREWASKRSSPSFFAGSGEREKWNGAVGCCVDELEF